MSDEMMIRGIGPLSQHQGLVVQQRKEWGEILTGWETRNRYAVHSDDGTVLYHAGEVGTGWLSRNFLKSKRPFTVEIKDTAGALIYRLVRPWRWFFSGATLYDQTGSLVGSIEQRFKLFSRLYSIYDAEGTELARLRGPLLKPWTFWLEAGGESLGSIKKKWSGLLKEAFTEADNFRVEFGAAMDERLRSILLGVTFFVDFLHFESK